MALKTNNKKKFANIYKINCGETIRVVAVSKFKTMFFAEDIKDYLKLRNKDVKDFEQEKFLNGKTLKLIEESDLYRLIFISHTKKAEEFKKWVFKSVLPSIRQNGEYKQFFTTNKNFED